MEMYEIVIACAVYFVSFVGLILYTDEATEQGRLTQGEYRQSCVIAAIPVLNAAALIVCLFSALMRWAFSDKAEV